MWLSFLSEPSHGFHVTGFFLALFFLIRFFHSFIRVDNSHLGRMFSCSMVLGEMTIKLWGKIEGRNGVSFEG